MQEQLSRRRDKLFSLGLHMQPLVVLVGTVEKPEAVYVVVDHCTWKILTALKAVYICFNLRHSTSSTRRIQPRPLHGCFCRN